MSLYELRNARYEAQADEMRRLEAAGQCLFCPPLADGDPSAVVRSSQHWVVRYNKFPYVGTKLHLLLVPRSHVTDLLDLTPDELAEFWVVARQLRDEYGLTFYGLGARCGECLYTGGTIAHVHVHMLVGDVDNPEHVPVRVKLSSRPE